MITGADHPDLCVTGAEARLRDLAARLDANAAFMQEVRLDLLERLDDDVFELLSGQPNLILTCRGEAEGGGFTGSEVEQAEVLRRALALKPACLDVELSAPLLLRRGLYRDRGDTRLILSWHCFEPGGLGSVPARELSAQPADLLKVALAVEDAAELADLQRVMADERRQVMRIGMGPAGLLSRALFSSFGALWSYVTDEPSTATAPGQLTHEQAIDWRVGVGGLVPLALLGGPQVMSSPGARVYNRIFTRRDLPFIYLPVVTARPGETLALLEQLGFGGCSVTMPAKEALAGAVHGWLPDSGEELGALNTILLRDGRRTAANTDVSGLRRLLAPHAGQDALVLGSGGAARAVVAALGALGCRVTVAGVEEDQVAGLARELSAAAVEWDHRADAPFHLLVNTTPLGSRGRRDPMPAGVDYTGRAVLDAVLREEPTPLRRAAAAGGGQAMGGLSWWVQQGAEQITLLTGEEITVPELEDVLNIR